ncbi:MAG: ATP-binding cassette domain-containing protein [Oscillospiraceae bacterium]
MLSAFISVVLFLIGQNLGDAADRGRTCDGGGDHGREKVLLSIKDLWVKFRVRGRVLTAIRNVSLDIYENESIAIVGESGCGKSVLTKTFAGMLDNNGFIDGGSIVFNDETLTEVSLTSARAP